MKRGLVLGCGGTLGAAWTIGVLAALERSLGWDARDAEVIVGTSAGAELGLMLGAGVGVDELLAAHRDEPTARLALRHHFRQPPRSLPPLPWPRPGYPGLARADVARLTALSGLLPAGRDDAAWLARLADELAPGGWVPHPATWLVAADTATGVRVAFGSPGAPKAAIRDAVRASWAVPGWFPPVQIGGRAYADGGIVSPTSADLVHDVDEVVIIAPMASAHPGRRRGAGRIEQLLRAPMTRRLDAEVAGLEAAGVHVVRVDPGPADLAAMGPNLMNSRHRHRVRETALSKESVTWSTS